MASKVMPDRLQKLYRGTTVEGIINMEQKTGKVTEDFVQQSGSVVVFVATVKTDIIAKSEWVFGYVAGVAGLYFCYKNGETSRLREEVAEQNKIIGRLVDDVGRCGQLQSACWNLFPRFAEQVLNIKPGT
ncbi:hypothetical protein DCAR_0518504 [Daucus carota subsp. sativus]|uniref:Uncharacterized protein n=2 Tax=Daucus carota subsp. sativus TaxID=79200 RepID=A0A164XAH1_DAUCS|nr:PREDICTED: uncharacterized protein LOC108220747 isoform X2 [Daucus carota subsp. sativus]XP_017250088.1 PREDICTED: uncharacterized protein LOC108220747 isoform X2 [Daucus carota subsp. sativus]XP_017250089.1 PREDICTED: uncharacterized protein LOC108220747 isoform X2 [Daucus carota subsp. sativus]WOG99156.1 hypothetical protein DCAR_0518504 [Daucus carota subsp. sativus]